MMGSEKVRDERERRAFWSGFWQAYGRAHMTGLVAGLLLLLPFADRSSATAFSAAGAYLLWSFGSMIYAFTSGEDAAREWRNRQSTP